MEAILIWLQKKVSAYPINCLKEKKQRFHVMHLKELTQTNHLHLYLMFSMVYPESGLKTGKSIKITDTMNRTILVATANQKPASICILEKYYVTKSTAGSTVTDTVSARMPDDRV